MTGPRIRTTTPPIARDRTTKRRLGLAALAVVLLGAGYFGWQSYERRQAVRSFQPALPDLRSRPEALRDRLAAVSAGHSLRELAEASRLYHANGFLAEAARCYVGLERLQPREPRWWHRHGTILAGFGDAEPALAAFARVIALAPDYRPAWLRRADLLAKTNRVDEAVRAYTDVLTRQPGEPYATLGLARIDVDAGRWEAARTKLEAVVRATQYELGYDLLVTVYEQLGRTAEAAALRGRAKAAGSYRDPPDPWMDELLGDCFDAYPLSLAAGVAARSGRPAEAVSLLERAVALAPDDVAIRFQLAGVLLERGDAARARAELERCTQGAPGFPDAWAHLAALLERGGDARGAAAVVAAGLRANPQSPGLHLMSARQLRDAGQSVGAIDEYRASIRLRPNEADAYVELATTLFRSERIGDGVAVLEQALAAEPVHPMALALLALHAINGGDAAGAERWMTAVRDQPRVPAEQREQLRSAYRQQFRREAP